MWTYAAWVLTVAIVAVALVAVGITAWQAWHQRDASWFIFVGILVAFGVVSYMGFVRR